MPTPTSTPSATRPGGRSTRIRAAVHRAVVELVAEGPAEALTMPAIAARAGVHPTTVYRRWPSLAELLNEVAISRFSGDIVVPDTGTLRGDLTRWATDVVVDFADRDVLALVRTTVGTSPTGGYACIADRHAQLDAILEHERSRGGEPPDLGRAVDALLAPLYYRVIFTSTPVEPTWAASAVDELLR